MSEMNLPPEFESNLRRAMHVPAPNTVFVARLRSQLEQEAHTMQTQKHRISPRLAWGLAAGLLVLIIALLATSPTVVAAMKRLFGYVPGVGLVEQGSALRVIAEPIVVTRDGITLTVTQAIASPEKTIIAYKVENIPESALAPNYKEGETPPPSCNLMDYLQLPDGTVFAPSGGQGGSWFLGFEFRETFDAIPVEVNSANLLISCLLNTSPGKAPENWIIPLSFVPAPPDMTVVPVIEVSPSPAPTSEPGTDLTTTPIPNPISLEKVIELENGYILIGSVHSVTTADGLITSPFPWNVRIVDANGQDVPYDYATDVDLSSGDGQSSPWAYKITGKAQAWPLSISIDSMDATLPEHEARFEFDTGPAPQTDQQWTLNQDVRVGDYSVRVLNAVRTPDGYAFFFQADPVVTSVNVNIRGFDIAPAGGGGGGDGAGSLSSGVSYTGPIPEGKLTVVLDTVTILIPGPWSIQWQPGDANLQAAPTPSSGPAACLTDDIWAQVKASVPTQIPSELSGRFYILGQKANTGVYGVNMFALAVQSNTFLAEAYWPVASPDGSQVVFTTDYGLTIYTLATDETLPLPGTDTSDYRTLWSPDGSRLAFIRSSTNQMMVINADGTGQQPVRDNSAVYHLLVGWADSTHLLITEPGPDGVIVQSLDLTDNTTVNLFTISSNKADTVVAPDGQWIAFTSSRGGNGMLGNGLYISRLDGSQRRMVAALNGRALYFPVWSPDDRWLIVSMPELDDTGPARQALIELDTCRVIPLPDLNGEIYSWGK